MGDSVEEDSRSREGVGHSLQVVGRSGHSPEAVGNSLLHRLLLRRLREGVGSAAGMGHIRIVGWRWRVTVVTFVPSLRISIRIVSSVGI